MKVRNGIFASLGMAIWWLLFFALWMGWLGPISIVAAIIMLAAISLRFRDHRQIVPVWMPAIAFTGLCTLAAALTVFIALVVLVGYHAQSLFGALSAGVFVLMAIPIAAAGILAAVIFFLLVKYRPRSFSQPLSSLATINTLALGAFLVTCLQTLSIFGSDPMIVHVLDSQDRPINHVTVHYANYTTRADGGTETEPEESGTLITDGEGTVKLSPNHTARHVVLDLSKDGYEKVKATVVNDDVGMGEQGYRVVHVQLDGRRDDAAQIQVPNKHPIEIKLYLPTDKEGPSPEMEVNFGGSWPSSGEMYLKISDGTMSESPPGDLKFQIVKDVVADGPTKYFKVTALNGARVTSDHGPGPNSVEGMLSVAPENHFTESLMIDWFPEFYYRSSDRKLYARIEVSDLGSYQPPYKRGPKGKIFLWTINQR